jgi:hypothetical protein
MGTKFYTYHNIIAISTPVKMFGHRQRYYNSIIGQNWFGIENVKNMCEELFVLLC